MYRVKLHAFEKFEDTAQALAAATAVVEGKLDKDLKSFLKKWVSKKGLKEGTLSTDSVILVQRIEKQLAMVVPCGRIDMVVVFLRAELAVSDPKLAGLIKEKLEINCLAGTENIVAGMSLRHFSIAWVCRLSGAKLSFEKQGRDQVILKCVLLFIS